MPNPSALRSPTSDSPAFIAVEGLDGSGKSTLTEHLARSLGAELHTTPNAQLRSLRPDILEGLADSPVARQAFYLATVAHASDHIRRSLQRGRSVVLDRYLLSTMVYAAQRGEFLRWPALEDWLLPPDLTVFLDLPLQVRERRLAQRGLSAADVETLDPAFDAGLRAGYRRWAVHSAVGRFLHLELTGHESPGAIARRVLDVLGRRGAA